jgi:protein-S-isoprenylcysteine O-methyltransferase Ste14
MVRIGNFFFRVRNGLFPVAYVLLFVPSPPVFADYRTALLLGLAVAVLGQGVRAITIGLDYIIRGGRNRRVYAEKLVSGGIFAHCRNPLYVGNFLLLVGVGIASNSLLFLAAAIPFFAFAYWAIIAAEENFLRGKFGAEYDEYCARVNRIVPNFAGLSETLAGMRFNWRRLINVEYGTTYLWMAALVLVTYMNARQAGEFTRHPGGRWVLTVVLLVVSLGYLAARIAKKTGRLEDPQD